MALIYSTDLTDTSAISSGSVIKIPEGQTMTLHNTAVRSIEKVTLLIDGSLQLADDIVMPDQSAIILSATGSIAPAPDFSGSVKLTGQNTRFSAPPVCVFSPDVKVDGTWLMDKAYVAWFDQSNAVEKFGQSTRSDDAGAINGALSMAPPGEVLLEGKTYNISTPIDIPAGRILVGTSCLTYSNIHTTTDFTRVTKIVPSDDLYDSSTYCVYMNANPTTKSWIKEYPFPGTGMRNIAFKYDNAGAGANNWFPCILAGGGFTLCNIRWSGFYQAVKVTDNYADQRTIRSCFFGFNPMNDGFVIPNGYSFPELYAFDLFALGDAQEIDQLSVDHPYGALKIGYNGTSVHDSIINGSVLIQSARACAFRNIHMEQPTAGFPRDVAINVVDSSVSISDCDFELGTRTFVTIKNDVYQNSNIVTLSNCCFDYNAGMRRDIKGTTENPFDTPNDARIKKTSVYDMQIDLQSIVNITNCYRITFPDSDYSTIMVSSGLWLHHPAVNDPTQLVQFNEFNLGSNNYSQSSQICDLRISSCVSQPAPGSSANLYSLSLNSVQSNWLSLSGDIRYAYKFLGPSDPITNDMSLTSLSGSVYIPLAPNSEIRNLKYMVSMLVGAYDPRWNTRLIIERKIFANHQSTDPISTQYAYIPICGTRKLYDNGYTINGYKWYDSITAIFSN